MDEFQRRENEVEEPPNHGEEENKDIISTDLEDYQGSPPGAIDPYSKRNEEMATELTADDYDEAIKTGEKETNMGTQVNSAVGWAALILSLISFFMMPVILGGAGIILGFISKNRGADTLGNTAIVAGAISILITLFVLPYV
ncbi:hypothetical protein ACFQ3N_08850 [Virgibacillus byunsanensis]|uniref:DUF4190 domain-containing protein n=1 Tax=Virgibacillus byunsanensis TaxID=570945 RepID=A0ABW3LJD5_9BACI